MTGTVPRESDFSPPVSGVEPTVTIVGSDESRYLVATDAPSTERAVDADRRIAIADDRTVLGLL